MERITTVKGLKSAIQILEVEQYEKERMLKDHLHQAFESLKPANLLKDAIRELVRPNYLKSNENLAGSAVGAVSGFFLRKLLVGSSNNYFRKLLGKAIQFGMTKVAARKSDAITSAGVSMFSRLFRKKRNPEDSGR